MYSFFKNLVDNKFNQLQAIIIAYVSGNLANWHIDPHDFAPVLDAQAKWDLAYQKFLDDPNLSRLIRYDKEETRKVFVNTLVSFLKKFVYGNPLLTGHDFEAMSLPEGSFSKSNNQPLNSSSMPVTRIMTDRFGNSFLVVTNQLGSQIKPNNKCIVHVRYALKGEALDEKNGADLFHSKSKVSLDLPASYTGQVVSAIVRWVSHDGQVSRFSAPIDFIAK